MVHKLPASVASSQDLAELLIEVREYAKWASHELIKQKAGIKKSKSIPPESSSACKELIHQINNGNQLSQSQLDKLVKSLESYQKSAPVITVTLAALPASDVKTRLVGWCRAEIAPNVLVSFKAKRTIFGGMVVQHGSRIFDWSFARQLNDTPVTFREVLEHV